MIQWAILNGERETAATLHYVDDGVDTGPVIADIPIPIGDRDDADVVRERLMDAGQRLLREWWPHRRRWNYTVETPIFFDVFKPHLKVKQAKS